MTADGAPRYHAFLLSVIQHLASAFCQREARSQTEVTRLRALPDRLECERATGKRPFYS
jgi:hypothetical protein